MASLVIGAIGAGLIVVGVAALRRQSNATSCPMHSHVVGRVAVFLAWACMIAGTGALVAAVVVYRANQGQDMSRLFSAVRKWLGVESAPYRLPALDQTEAERVVDRLIGMGFLKFVAEPQKAEVRRQLIETATNRYLDSDWDDQCVAADLRSYPADAEDLAEGQVGATMLLMKPVLEKEGVKLGSVVDDFGDEKYEVVVNGQRHLIYESGQDSWTLGLKRLLEITNGLLEEAGSAERLYAVYGGHEGRVMLLTEEMLGYLESHADVLDHGWMPRRSEEFGDG
jgi:hypothetical protein